MLNHSGTVVAVATPIGKGGVAVIRVSGALGLPIAEKITGKIPAPRNAVYTSFKNQAGQTIDTGLVIYFQAPHSYTGEDIVEFHCHGGHWVTQCLVAECLALGARLADPGEFTLRAFLNNKLDLVQAEAVADLIEASSVEAVYSAARSLTGEFSRAVHEVLDALVDLRLLIEAHLDFPEEETITLDEQKIEVALQSLEEKLRRIRTVAHQGSLLKEGVNVVLIGQPNVGKSSLMNNLSAEDVAIVTDVPGTTRDVVKNTIVLEGIPIQIIDTAGLRETEDVVEQQGISRAWQSIQKAQVALVVIDVRCGIQQEEQRFLTALPTDTQYLLVHNKIDLVDKKWPGFSDEQQVYISAKTGEGIDELKQKLLTLVGWKKTGESIFLARTRHLERLQEVQQSIQAARDVLHQGELLAEELRVAQQALSAITGDFSADDLLGKIFSQFCIGK